MEADSKSRKWSFLDKDRLLCKAWEDEFIVYDSASGDTHLLDKTSWKILNRLNAQPLSSAELIREINQECGMAIHITPDSIEELLTKFGNLSLAELT